MEWTQFIIMLVGMFGLFAWNRTESRSDNRQIVALVDAMNKEMRDFHGRLCAIEERNKGGRL